MICPSSRDLEKDLLSPSELQQIAHPFKLVEVKTFGASGSAGEFRHLIGRCLLELIHDKHALPKAVWKLQQLHVNILSYYSIKVPAYLVRTRGQVLQYAFHRVYLVFDPFQLFR